MVIFLDKRIYLILIMIISLSIVASAGSASAASSRSYTIPYINMDLYLNDDGSIHVTETLHYSFKGTYNGVYRDIPLNGSQSLKNINVSTQGAYSNFTVTNQSNNERITVSLYSDPGKTTPITDKDVNITYNYDFLNIVKFYNDTAELQYKLVGQGWPVNIGGVNATIHLKSSEGVNYWFNPPYDVINSAWQGNNLQVSSKTIQSGNYFEVRMTIPKNQFAATPTNGIIINQNGLNEIETIQNNYQNQINFESNLYSILTILMLLACFTPLIIYYRYGREPKIDYKAEYERDIPTNDPPAVVNAICGPGFSKKIGQPDMDGFKATIMDLINRKYLLFENKSVNEEDDLVPSSMYLKVNTDKDISKLKEFEMDVLDFLREFEEDGIIAMNRISTGLSDRATAQSFRNTYNNWKNDIHSKLLTDDMLKKIFNKKGDTIIKIFGVLGLIISAVVFIITILSPLPAAYYALIASIILAVVSIISLILPQTIGGQWTTYGEEYDAKWHNFKKYIKDFSLIKEYPPESVKIWNKYLVYATALGVADAVRKAMELYLPNDELEGSDLYMFHYYGGYALLASSFDSGMSTAVSGNIDDADFSGVGDIGGGFGGGGGGAF